MERVKNLFITFIILIMFCLLLFLSYSYHNVKNINEELKQDNYSLRTQVKDYKHRITEIRNEYEVKCRA